jgi:hypothetical protein
MLIRVTGGREGIREYLENGKKQGRGFDRDELDERVILRGDLAITDAIISGMTGSGDKYLHVTASFKEDEISREVLEAFAVDFEEFAFAAFDGDEYDYYVEAHLPKIKSEIDEQTGRFFERKPHIHIVIPKTNLLSGQYLSPFGRFEQNERFVFAFQEWFNHKHGLASPRDNRRVEFTGASESISRYKGDLFATTGRDVKERVLSEVLNKKITSYDDFKKMLGTIGEVKTRNEGREDEYLHVKAAGDSKGTNLREFVFSREFIELPDAQKRDRLAVEVERRYEVGGPSRKPPEAHLATLADWRERRQKELKYLNSGNRKVYQQYKQADPGQRKAILADRAARFYAKHRQEQDYGRTDASSRLGRIGDNLRTASHHLEAAGRDIEKARRTVGTATNLADRGNRRALAAAIERVAGTQIRTERVRLETGQSVRRAADSVTAQLARDAGEKGKQTRAGGLTEFQLIKRELDAKRLLNRLSQSHGVIPEKYEVTKGKDGSDRIKCGSRSLNVSDFVTKEMNLSWKDAAPILRAAYREQTGGKVDTLARQQPSEKLWQDYQAWRKGRVDERQQKWERQRDSERARRIEIKKDFDRAKALNYAKYPARSKIRPTTEQRRATMSVIRMNRAQREMTLRESIETERAALKEQYQKPYQEQYREFLSERAQSGDELALNELRRVRAEVQTGRSNEARIAAGEERSAQRDERLVRDSDLTYQVHRNGDVTYSRGGKAVLRDEGKSVRVLKTDDKTIETGLRLAVQKYGGGSLALAGSAEFQKRAAELVAEKGMRVTFVDERLNQIVRDRQRSMADEAKHLSRAREYMKATDNSRSTQAETRAVQPKEVMPGIDSKAADIVKGRYTGKVVSVDQDFVYQQSGQQTVRHDRKQFNELPKLGDKLKVAYRQGVANVKNLGPEKEIDTGLGL